MNSFLLENANQNSNGYTTVCEHILGDCYLERDNQYLPEQKILQLRLAVLLCQMETARTKTRPSNMGNEIGKNKH